MNFVLLEQILLRQKVPNLVSTIIVLSSLLLCRYIITMSNYLGIITIIMTPKRN